MKIKQYIDEDFFWKKFQSLDKLSQDEWIHIMFSFGGVADDFFKQGKLSKITANRVREGCYRLYSHSEYKPSERKEQLRTKGYLMKDTDLYLFKNAFKKFKDISVKEKNKQLKKKLKFWANIRLNSVLY